jgi:NADPH oxidase
LHKATGWLIIVWTVVHVLAHMVNFYKFARDASTTGQRIGAFFAVNFTIGPGVTGLIMAASLLP